MISLVTAAVPTWPGACATVAGLTRSDPRILGSHLEGPFLDVGHKGAHDPSLLHTATRAEIDALLDAADGTLRQITLAPELPVGWTRCARSRKPESPWRSGTPPPTTTRRWPPSTPGARILTHAFNAMPGVHHRAPAPWPRRREPPA